MVEDGLMTPGVVCWTQLRAEPVFVVLPQISPDVIVLTIPDK